MFATLIQDFNGNTVDPGVYVGTGVSVAYMIVMFMIWAVVVVLVVGGMWKVFTKAGEPGWFAIVPILNTYTMIKIARRPGWWLLLMFIPCINFVVAIIIMMDLAKAFGKDSAFGLGLAFLSPIFIPILGWGSASYVAGGDPYVPYAPTGGYVPPAGFGGGTTGAWGAQAPAGWYPDPSGQGQRWWDGTAWTDHHAD